MLTGSYRKRRPGAALLLLLLSLVACAAPASRRSSLAPEAAPFPTPPGDLSLDRRIAWWERQVPRLAPEDRSEARLQLGQLQLEAGRSRDARISFRELLVGPHSREEAGQAELGIGLAYILEGDPEAAGEHLEAARRRLPPGPRAECAWLLARIRGEETLPELEAGAAARLEAFLGRAGPGLGVSAAPESAALYQVSRAEWGARPIRRNHRPMGRIWRITIHHSAEPLRSSGLAASEAEVARLQRIHQERRDPEPWADIGYHFLIDRAGRVIQGRSLDIQGAHAGGQANVGNIGVCLLGNFESQPGRGPDYAVAQAPTAAQLQALEELVEQLRRRYRIPRSQVWPHSHFRKTECPGTVLRHWVEEYRRGSPG